MTMTITLFRYTFLLSLSVCIFSSISVCYAQPELSRISGQVIDTDGKPVTNIVIAVKPANVERGGLKQRTPFPTWLRDVTDKEGRFSIPNIEPLTSQFVLFPEHGSDHELISIEINDVTIYSIAFRRGMPVSFGKIAFSIEPGKHLENVIINVKPPRMRIRGQVLLEDGTPLINEKIELSIHSSTVQILPGGARGGSSSNLKRSFMTDNEGYFVTYSQDKPAKYTVTINYNGFTHTSNDIDLNDGERYDDLVFVVKDINRKKKPKTVWIQNPSTGSMYKKIQCNSLLNARTMAQSENANLLAINDEVEQKWIEGLFPEKTCFWIGLSLPKENEPWVWNNKQPLTYENWRTGKKPMYPVTGSKKIGVIMDFSNKKWVAIEPGNILSRVVKYAIIEKEPNNTETMKE